MKPQLDALADRLKKDDSLRISVVAHASGTGNQTSVARRVSLARALAVRAYLIDQGVDNLRINVQAEGSRDAGDQPDRVEMFLLAPVKE
jgi:outer membrane protein OmpA-like peptidoglycan-associated protein